MRIESVDVTVVRVPLDPPRRSGLGTFTHDEFGIIEIRCTDGTTGLGEIATLWDGGAAVQAFFAREVLAPRLIGEDPRRLVHCLRLLATLQERFLPAKAGIDMALHDLAARAAGVPVHALLGGRTRDEIVLSRSIHMGSPEEMAERAAAAVAAGFRCVKVKVGRADRSDDLAAVRAVRRAIGADALLRVDANMAWPTSSEAAKAIEALAEFDLHSVEQPLPPHDLEGLRELRRTTSVPVMVDESVWGIDDAWKVVTTRAADLINVYVAEAGGLAPARDIFTVADLAGVRCVIGAMPELGIGTAASIHLAAAVPTLVDPCDASGTLYQVHDVISETFDYTGGVVGVPTTPGLGVTLDRDRLREFTVRETG